MKSFFEKIKEQVSCENPKIPSKEVDTVLQGLMLGLRMGFTFTGSFALSMAEKMPDYKQFANLVKDSCIEIQKEMGIPPTAIEGDLEKDLGIVSAASIKEIKDFFNGA